MVGQRKFLSSKPQSEAIELVGQPVASGLGISRGVGVGAILLGCKYREANADDQVGDEVNIPIKPDSNSCGKSLAHYCDDGQIELCVALPSAVATNCSPVPIRAASTLPPSIR